MNRPYIICHMLQSIDGRISGQFFHDENTQNLSSIYKEMSNQFNADGIIYGSVTAKEIFTYGNPKQIYTDSKQNRRGLQALHPPHQRYREEYYLNSRRGAPDLKVVPAADHRSRSQPFVPP